MLLRLFLYAVQRTKLGTAVRDDNNGIIIIYGLIRARTSEAFDVDNSKIDFSARTSLHLYDCCIESVHERIRSVGENIFFFRPTLYWLCTIRIIYE